jgi:hypothetical protein
MTSFDVNTREWFMNDIIEEIIKKNITMTEYTHRFLNWIDDIKFHLNFNWVRYDSLIDRAYKASKKMRAEFKYFEESNMVKITDYRCQMNQNIEEENEKKRFQWIAF